jgi:hypothetical protein
MFCLALSFKTAITLSCFSNMFSWQTYNALFILRCITKFFVENLKEEDLVRQFEARPLHQVDGKLVITLMSSSYYNNYYFFLHVLLNFLFCSVKSKVEHVLK